jgi:putative transposase
VNSTLIRRLAQENPLWGAEHIRGELIKLGVPCAKSTVQKYLKGQRRKKGGQTWRTFVHNHAHPTWAFDFVPTYDLLFRAIFIFVIVELGSRRVVHVGVTRRPTSAWVAQQLREATPFGHGPKYLIRDNDAKYGVQLDRVAQGVGIHILRTPVEAPQANAIVERFLGSLWRECLDHCLILGERHLLKLVTEYIIYFNQARPHQGLRQRIPSMSHFTEPTSLQTRVIGVPVLGGLHRHYTRAA